MLTATLTDATPELDTLSVYKDNRAVDRIKVAPTGSAVDYEKALRDAGYLPVSFDGDFWTVEEVAA